MRGLTASLNAGRVFQLPFSNRNSGMLIQAGFAAITHRINIQIIKNDVPQLNDDYVKGYDRSSFGWAFQGFVGYIHHGENRLINFYIGADIIRAWVKNLRGYNYDLRQYDTNIHDDYVLGLRFGWMIPIYLQTKDEDEFRFQ